MSRPEDKQSPPSQDAPADENRAGRVVVDARGRNVWQWAKAALDSTSILLKRLENKDLALEPTQKVPVMRGTDARTNAKAPGKPAGPAKPGTKSVDDRSAPQKGANRGGPTRGASRGDTGGGFDPYNSR
jgi:hypothetical protein